MGRLSPQPGECGSIAPQSAKATASTRHHSLARRADAFDASATPMSLCCARARTQLS